MDSGRQVMTPPRARSPGCKPPATLLRQRLALGSQNLMTAVDLDIGLLETCTHAASSARKLLQLGHLQLLAAYAGTVADAPVGWETESGNFQTTYQPLVLLLPSAAPAAPGLRPDRATVPIWVSELAARLLLPIETIEIELLRTETHHRPIEACRTLGM